MWCSLYAAFRSARRRALRVVSAVLRTGQPFCCVGAVGQGQQFDCFTNEALSVSGERDADKSVSAKLQAPVIGQCTQDERPRKTGVPGGIPRAAFSALFGGAKRAPRRNAEPPL